MDRSVFFFFDDWLDSKKQKTKKKTLSLLIVKSSILVSRAGEYDLDVEACECVKRSMNSSLQILMKIIYMNDSRPLLGMRGHPVDLMKE